VIAEDLVLCTNKFGAGKRGLRYFQAIPVTEEPNLPPFAFQQDVTGIAYVLKQGRSRSFEIADEDVTFVMVVVLLP
jgi:hypothetical protein